MKIAIPLLATGLGLIVANYGFQAFAEMPSFMAATERSFFQAMALGVAYLTIRTANLKITK